MPIGLNPKLRQVGTDTDQATGRLSLNHTRARVKDRRTGPISLRELSGATTGMSAEHNATWGTAPARVHISYIKEIYADIKKCEFPTGDMTKTIKMTCSGKYSETDATVEVRLLGYSEPGTYRIEGTATPDFGTGGGSPHSVAVVCHQVKWFQGGQVLPWNSTQSTAQNYSATFSVPAGYPYISLVLYQYVYLNSQPGRPNGSYYTPYATTFTDFRIKRLS